MNKTKEERIEELNEVLMNLFTNSSSKKQAMAELLCGHIAFMKITLDDLKEKIDKEGTILETINGNGFPVVIENPASKTYNSMIKNYTNTFKQLKDLFPKKGEDEEGEKRMDELELFLNDYDKWCEFNGKDPEA